MTRHERPIEPSIGTNSLRASEVLNVFLSLQIGPIECIHYFNQVTELTVLGPIDHNLSSGEDVV
jgi:hypothetical protein